jgi:hypothetical protein
MGCPRGYGRLWEPLTRTVAGSAARTKSSGSGSGSSRTMDASSSRCVSSDRCTTHPPSPSPSLTHVPRLRPTHNLAATRKPLQAATGHANQQGAWRTVSSDTSSGVRWSTCSSKRPSASASAALRSGDADGDSGLPPRATWYMLAEEAGREGSCACVLRPVGRGTDQGTAEAGRGGPAFLRWARERERERESVRIATTHRRRVNTPSRHRTV